MSNAEVLERHLGEILLGLSPCCLAAVALQAQFSISWGRLSRVQDGQRPILRVTDVTCAAQCNNEACDGWMLVPSIGVLAHFTLKRIIQCGPSPF
jgi:hypothetical protein